MKVPTKTLRQHDQDVAEIRQRLLHLHADQQAKAEIYSKRQASYVSNTTFNPSYPHLGHELGINRLNSILKIDKEKRIVIVEPRVPMDQLVYATLQEGMVPPVVPEFKSITVGGAINGAGIESSSHLYGQFNDSCIAYEVLLGNGELLRVTRTDHSDLFFALTGSYGSLGLIVSVELKLIPSSSWIELKYYHFNTVSAALTFIHDLHKSVKPPEFIEGLIFAENQIAIIEGRFISQEEASDIKKRLSLHAPWDPWYYSHVEKKNQNNQSETEKIQLFDYLFRHDRGAFWMGAYALHYGLFLRYFIETQLKQPKLSEHLFGKTSFENYFKLKKPNLAFRCLVGYWMSSRHLYRMLHSCAENWFGEKFIIQDYFIPLENSEEFIRRSMKKLGIFPLWLCPVKPTNEAQILSPHYAKSSKSQLLIDVGIYGMPQETTSLPHLNQLLDKWTSDLEGRKMLYTHFYYSEEDFWNIYSKHDYESLREKYKANEMWIHIYEKLSHR